MLIRELISNAAEPFQYRHRNTFSKIAEFTLNSLTRISAQKSMAK